MLRRGKERSTMQKKNKSATAIYKPSAQTAWLAILWLDLQFTKIASNKGANWFISFYIYIYNVIWT